jgi:DNA-binding LacI/PurR family transcriptional regulator
MPSMFNRSLRTLRKICPYLPKTLSTTKSVLKRFSLHSPRLIAPPLEHCQERSAGPLPRLALEAGLCETAPVPTSRKSGKRLEPDARPRRVSLKVLADSLGLSPATVSLVMNQAPTADSIPRATQERIFAAARELNYRPSFSARWARTARSFTIGVLVPEVSEGYAALVMSGIEGLLLREGYFYLVASHRHHADLIDEYPRLLLARSVDGLIAVDTPWHHELPVPVVTVSGHNRSGAVTNLVLDHDRAAELALDHLRQLGHKSIAFIKGQEFSSDTAARWESIVQVASRLGLEVSPKLTVQLEGDLASPELGYRVTRRLLEGKARFTALFAFNDVSAIGAIEALRSHGLEVPKDVSVVGFDDIQSAAFHSPRLTTVRQPLKKMGMIAAEALLRRIARPDDDTYPREIVIEPELIVRESTTRAAKPH